MPLQGSIHETLQYFQKLYLHFLEFICLKLHMRFLKIIIVKHLFLRSLEIITRVCELEAWALIRKMAFSKIFFEPD